MKLCKLKQNVKITIGFWIVLAVLIYLDGQGFVICCLAACTLHELGHWLTIKRLGGVVQSVKLTAVGAEMKLDSRHMLSYGKEAVAALAGPAVNFFVACIAVIFECYLFAAANLSFGAINLLPARAFDGGRILSSVLRISCPNRADVVMHWIAASMTGILAGIGWVAWSKWGNLTLFLASLWLIFGMIKNKS